MASAQTIHVSDVINDNKITAFQYLLVSLCGLVMFLDGFDTQAISYMAPLMAKEWNLPQEMRGPIFSSALTGLMVGYLILSPLSNWFGHRRMLLVSTVTFAVFTLATVFVSDAIEVITLRFLIGMGLGAAIPSAVALTRACFGRLDPMAGGSTGMHRPRAGQSRENRAGMSARWG